MSLALRKEDHMDSMENFEECFESLEHRTVGLTLRLCLWRGMACGVGEKESRMKQISKAVGYVMGVGVLLVVLEAITVAAAPCHVPSSAYPAIQAAVNDATCATIPVAAGTYTEQLTI